MDRLAACTALRLTLAVGNTQFDKVLAAYKAKSRYWNPTLNKFAEGASLVLPHLLSGFHSSAHRICALCMQCA